MRAVALTHPRHRLVASTGSLLNAKQTRYDVRRRGASNMRLSELNYKLYRGSNGATSFWRWEVLLKRKVRTPLKSGFLYGTQADAKQCASAAMSELAQTKERLQRKSNRHV